jgi:hypothetical protein
MEAPLEVFSLRAPITNVRAAREASKAHRIGRGMNVLILRMAVVGVALLGARSASAGSSLIESDLANAYYFVEHYEVLIDRAPGAVWPHLLDMGSWMYRFDMIPVSGPQSEERQVFRLYAGEEFFFEIVKVIPGRMIVGVNLPSTMHGEEMIGVSMLTLTEVNGRSLVAIFMSRHNTWPEAGKNLLRETRDSAEFRESTHAMWDGFMQRLRELAESG